jgi:hypothetical protein
MLDAAGSGSKEEAKSTLGRVIMRVIDWGYRSRWEAGSALANRFLLDLILEVARL